MVGEVVGEGRGEDGGGVMGIHSIKVQVSCILEYLLMHSAMHITAGMH